MPPKLKKKENLEKRRLAQKLCKKRRYIEIKNDPELLEIEKKKRRERYLKQKEANKEIPKSSRTIKEQRKKWKENSKRYRQKKKEESTRNSTYPLLERIDVVEAIENDSATSIDNKVTNTIQDDPIHNCPKMKSALRKVRYVELKKRKQLLRRLVDYKKRDKAQRKHIKRLQQQLREMRVGNIDRDNDFDDSAPYTSTTKIKESPFIERVKNFYTEDAHSVISAGKKEFITRDKVRMQKRYLCLPLKELYNKFCTDTNVRISYSFFCKLRPFWVLFPKNINRETCQCSVHVNMELLITALNKASILNEKNSQQVLLKLCCDSRNTNCLQRRCDACRSNHLIYNVQEENKNLTYFQWIRERKDTRTSGVLKKQILTVKKSFTISTKEAIENMEKSLITFFEHTYKMIGQYEAIKDLKNNLTIQEALVHLDFSENYSLKYAEEVQSFNFAGSRQQVCLHTAVIYTHCYNTGQVTPTSMCTISECLRHDASAIWAHLVSLLDKVIQLNPLIDTVHFLSDSPSSQYRNKTMFYIISQLHKDFSQLNSITWNYSEAGHGKGAPDGIGATLKRTADKMVLFGMDIGTFDQFYDLIKKLIKNDQLNIIIERVEEKDIMVKENLIPANLKPFRGTLSVHQVLWDKTSATNITLRTMTCFGCSALEKCVHGKHLGHVVVAHAVTQKIHVLSDITLRKANTQEIIPKPSTSKK